MIKYSGCIVCQSKIRFRFKVMAGDLSMDVYECPGCGCYIKSPYFDGEELSNLYRHYGAHEMHYDPSPGEIENIRMRLQRITRYQPKGSLLEIGCGRGYFLREALNAGWDATGLEFAGSAEKNLLDGLSSRVRFLSREEDMSFIPKNAYDVVCSYQVLEHLTHPLDSISAWAQALKPNGLLVIQTPHARSWGARFHGAHWAFHCLKEHFVIFSAQALKQIYHQEGLRVLHMDRGGLPFIASGQYQTLGIQPPSISILYRFKTALRIARKIIYALGLGDNIEIYGRKE